MTAAASDTHWNAMLGSGVQIDIGDATSLLGTWSDWVGEVRDSQPGGESVAGVVTEGAVKWVSVNRYERNTSARRACITAHGAVCRLDFAEMYGEAGEGFIHVRHLVQLSTIGQTFEIDPIDDLAPVCPNCHAMLHRGTDTPRTIDELRALIRGAARPGSGVTN
jgi:predicted HNH restriction endonuclease